MENDYTVPVGFESCDDNARRFVALVLEDIGFDMELYRTDDSEIERIENESRSGFIPFTDGGWRAMPFGDIGSAWGSGYHAGMLSDECERMQLDCMQSYIADNDLSDDAFVMSGADCWDIIDGLGDDKKQDFYEYESEWMSSAFYVDIRATYYAADNRRNRSGVDEVLLSVWLNLDEYGRECAGACVWSKLVSASALASVSDDRLDAIALQASGTAQEFNAVESQ